MDDGVHQFKVESVKSALGSLSDTDSGRIGAGPSMYLETDSWSLMSMIKRVTVLTSSESKSHRLELVESTKKPLTQDGVKLVKEIAAGFDNGMSPEKTEEGFGGTYFMANATGQKLAIFKPCDEEPFAPCNPKGFIGRALGDPGLKPTVRVGEAALREVAAYLLDHDSFAKIPTTLLIGASHPSFNYLINENPTGSAAQSPVEVNDVDLPVKLGSIQEYVPHLCDTTEMGTSKFSVSDVQRIAIQDIRFYNTDRHAGNILVRKIPLASRSLTDQQQHQFGETGYELVPIDHGFCLPEALEPPYFEWQHWSQARMPLGEKERDYIAQIDIEADKELLRSELPILKEECLRTMEVSTTLLKKCVAAGLSLNEIAEIMTRPLVGMDKEKSNLEKLCLEARDQIWSLSHSTTSDSEDSETHNESSSSSNHSRTDELMFKMDDWKDLNLVPEMDGLHSPFCSPNQLEECMEQLVLDGDDVSRHYCYNDLETTTNTMNPLLNGMRSIPQTTHRSMSMALPSSSVCFQKRRGNYNQRRGSGRRHSNDTPKRNATRVAYPPLIHGSLPGSENQIFHHVSQEEWPLFMEILRRLIDDGLKTGKWAVRSDFHKGSMSMNFGISCPRF
eukprot:g2752.t1